MPTRSYLSQVERTVTIGLGPDDTVRTLTVTWPDGVEANYRDVDPADVLVITQP